MIYLCNSVGVDVKDGAHVRSMINNWDKNRKKVTKPKTGRSRIARNDEVDAMLLAIFSNESIPDGNKVSKIVTSYIMRSFSSLSTI